MIVIRIVRMTMILICFDDCDSNKDDKDGKNGDDPYKW